MTKKNNHIPTDNPNDQLPAEASAAMEDAAAALNQATEMAADGQPSDTIEEVTTVKRKDSVNKAKKWRWKNPFRLTILDRYILGKFLGTFFLSTLLILAVVAMFDITEKLDAFLTAPLKERK